MDILKMSKMKNLIIVLKITFHVYNCYEYACIFKKKMFNNVIVFFGIFKQRIQKNPTQMLYEIIALNKILFI